jgi:hypothetical protein
VGAGGFQKLGPRPALAASPKQIALRRTVQKCTLKKQLPKAACPRPTTVVVTITHNFEIGPVDNQMTKEELLSSLALFITGKCGIECLVCEDAPATVLERLATLDREPLSKVQLNQLLGLREERGMSDGFFRYYWSSEPRTPYKLSKIPGFSSDFPKHDKIQDLDHFVHGLHRIFIDGLLYRGNVRGYYREFAIQSYDEIDRFVRSRLIDTDIVKARGPTLPLREISKDNRYLISEMACKSYGTAPKTESELKSALLAAWSEHEKAGGGQITVRQLLGESLSKTKYKADQGLLSFSADDILEESVASTADIERRYSRIADAFLTARTAALANTDLYLSMVNDLDVYVATSMRSRKDFRSMAERCDKIFNDPKVQDLHLRYFDPTMSAAEGHQDKGLIECLMVKCAKVLVYCAGDKESYGKDAEAAMALSLGKPVIFLCDEEQKRKFYREVHPLSRLIFFETGVAVGAMVTTKLEDVSELLDRIFENEMEFALVQPKDKPGYLQLVETLTQSVVRLQTNDTMLSEAFWNYYKSQR